LIRVNHVPPDKKNGNDVMTAIHDFEGQQTYNHLCRHTLGLISLPTRSLQNGDAMPNPATPVAIAALDDETLPCLRPPTTEFAPCVKPAAG
jgi:hypothetical protein